MGGYFFISTMVYNTMIRIKAMYSIVSTPSRKKGQKASPLQNQKGENRQPHGNACLYCSRWHRQAQQAQQKSGRKSCRFSLSIRITPRAQIPGIISRCARELRPGSAWALRAAILWRSPELRGYAIAFMPYHDFWSVLIRVMPQNTQKSGGIKPPLFAFYQNCSACIKARASPPAVRANCIRTQSG